MSTIRLTDWRATNSRPIWCSGYQGSFDVSYKHHSNSYLRWTWLIILGVGTALAEMSVRLWVSFIWSLNTVGDVTGSASRGCFRYTHRDSREQATVVINWASSLWFYNTIIFTHKNVLYCMICCISDVLWCMGNKISNFYSEILAYTVWEQLAHSSSQQKILVLYRPVSEWLI